MGVTPSDHATARRNLAQRIDRFLNETGAPAVLDPSGYQAAQVRTAIALLDEERFADGERAMMYAERANAFRPADFFDGEAKLLGIIELRALLERVAKGGG